MSELRLNIIEANDAINGTAHGAVGDAVVAALSAEPETIAELEYAMQRFIKPVDDRRPFALFHAGTDEEAWDAGIVTVDLAARIVAAESSYSATQFQGELQYHDGTQATDVSLLYRVPDDWLFVYSLDEYESARDKRRAERADGPRLDARQVLYGASMVEFIALECASVGGFARNASDSQSEIRNPQSSGLQSSPRVFAGLGGFARNASDSQSEIRNPQSSGLQSSPRVFAGLGGFARNASDSQSDFRNPQSEDPIAEIHSQWLMTPRADLQGKTAREVMLAKLDFIDFDLHTRELQWSLLGEGPPPLARDSFAYRFAGFGTHEYVLYYDLLRHLLSACLERVSGDELVDVAPEAARQPAARTLACAGPAWPNPRSAIRNPQSSGPPPGAENRQSEIRNPQSTLGAWLEELKQAWLNEPNEDFDGRIPSAIIESERRRIPMVMSAKQMMIDENCDVCRLMAGEAGEDFGPGFWHLDGCNMDQAFEFSTYRTREEWEAEQRRCQEFNKEFERNWTLEHPAVEDSDQEKADAEDNETLH